MTETICGLCGLAIDATLGPDEWHLLSADEAHELAPLYAGMPVHADCLAQEYDALDTITLEMEALARDLSARNGGAPVAWGISRVEPDPAQGGSALLVVREGEAKAE